MQADQGGGEDEAVGVSHFLLFSLPLFCVVSLLAQDASDLSPASAPCFSAANFVFLCCFSVTMVLQSCYVVFFPGRVGVFRPEWSVCGPQRWVCLDGASVLLFPEKAFPRSSAGFFCGVSSAPMQDLSVILLFVMLLFICVKDLNGSKIETLPMVA